MAFKIIQSLRGKLGLTNQGHFAYKELNITQPAVDATVAVAAASTSPRTITITLKDAYGAAIDYSETVKVCAFAAADRLALTTTGGSTGLAGTGLTAIVAKKVFLGTTSTAGVLTLTHTDTGTDAVAIGVKLPSGRWVMGDRVATIGT